MVLVVCDVCHAQISVADVVVYGTVNAISLWVGDHDTLQTHCPSRVTCCTYCEIQTYNNYLILKVSGIGNRET